MRYEVVRDIQGSACHWPDLWCPTTALCLRLHIPSVQATRTSSDMSDRDSRLSARSRLQIKMGLTFEHSIAPAWPSIICGAISRLNPCNLLKHDLVGFANLEPMPRQCSSSEVLQLTEESRPPSMASAAVILPVA